MPSEPSDGIFNRPPFTGTGQVRGNTRTAIADNTAISKPVRQHRNLETRHSRAGGNPDPRRGGNLSEMTETPRF
ncbi:TPA: hypothetical protein WNV81_001716 [Neisseria gonorrhoeae]|uniref:hypothetical protein n=1 Tax=Neisseria gonorrhoeae TaxID=485 RepID=UPI00309DAA22